ncbi:MAG: hypothetical protein ABUS51_04145 [Acidobacteriota bacterium]
MTVIIPHHKTKQEVVRTIDQAADGLFANGAGGSVQLVDPKKQWVDSTMSFSLTGRMGFISVPLAGTVAVDDVNVVVECELPPMIRNFVGETKVRSGIEQKMKEIVGA